MSASTNRPPASRRGQGARRTMASGLGVSSSWKSSSSSCFCGPGSGAGGGAGARRRARGVTITSVTGRGLARGMYAYYCTSLFDGDGLGEIAGLVDVGAALNRDVVGQELLRNVYENRLGP